VASPHFEKLLGLGATHLALFRVLVLAGIAAHGGEISQKAEENIF